MSQAPPMKIVIRIPHVSWRDGRPRFQPGAKLREEGWKGEDLRHPDGRYMTVEEAATWAASRDAEIATRRAALQQARRAKKKAPAFPAAASLRTVAGLLDEWTRSPMMQAATASNPAGKSQATIADYASKRRTLEAFDPLIAGAPVDALSKPIIYDLYERLVAARGLATARGCIATLSAALSWGIKTGRVKLAANPAQGLGLVTPPPRVRALTPAEVLALVAAADAIGLPEIGDAITIGVWTGQRQADRLAMTDAGLRDGWRTFRQLKTKAIVSIPETPHVGARLAAAADRRRGWKTVPLECVVDEERRAPFRDRTRYSKLFRRVRDAAVGGIKNEAGGWIVAPMPSVADIHDQDLRDTSVTWLARAGCSIQQTAAITGHSMEQITSVLKHYLAMHPQLAEEAIAKQLAWWNAETGDA